MSESAKSKKYNLLCETSRKSSDRNDCAVKAVAMIGRVSYKKAYELCKAQGRRDGHAMNNGKINQTFANMGFDVQQVENLYQKNGCRYTPKTIGQRLKTGYYILYVKGHVIPLINGTTFDWTSGRRHRIFIAFKIVRTRK